MLTLQAWYRNLVGSWDDLQDRLGVPLVSNPTLSASERHQLIMWSLIQGFDKDNFVHFLTSELPSLLAGKEVGLQNAICVACIRPSLKSEP